MPATKSMTYSKNGRTVVVTIGQTYKNIYTGKPMTVAGFDFRQDKITDAILEGHRKYDDPLTVEDVIIYDDEEWMYLTEAVQS